MRKVSIGLTIAALTLAPLSAQATSRGFDSTVTAPLQAPVKIEVILSEDLAYRANNLPEKLSDRGGARGLRSGFAGNGFYGDKALNELIEDVQEELSEDFAKEGLTISDDADTVLRITLEDVRNNRPTFEQLSRQPSLSFESYGIGGAELSADLINDTGETIGTLSYRWFETGLDRFDFPQANGVWTDARRAISRFSKKTAKTLS